MVGNNLKDAQLQQIVDKTIVFADKDEDGKISFDEFCSVVGNTDIHKKMVVDRRSLIGRSSMIKKTTINEQLNYESGVSPLTSHQEVPAP